MHTFPLKAQGLHFLKEYKGIWEMWHEKSHIFLDCADFSLLEWTEGHWAGWELQGHKISPSFSLSLLLSPVWRCVSDSPRGLWDMYGLSCLEHRSSLVTQEMHADMWQEVTDQYIAHTKDGERGDRGRGWKKITLFPQLCFLDSNEFK